MGKTFRRGGAERGYYSPGKSLRDKRQSSKGTNRSYESYDEYSTKRQSGSKNLKEKTKYYEG
tara:strand:+ start:342 stop:527 length:186 start_codon:yes stop_codon:yes gene_type:complete